MVKNFLIIALRNLRRNGLHSFINISGLSIGISSSILILLWIQDETSFDRFLPKVDRLYQVYVNASFDGKVNSWRSVPLPTYEEMKISDSNIRNSCVTGWGGDRLLTVEDIRLVKRGYYVSEEFLEMFEFPMVQGTHREALADPSSIVISETVAGIFFPGEDPMGKIIRVEDESTLKVTGVVKDIPGNSSFQFHYLIPWKHREKVDPWVVDNTTNWGNYSFQIFVELNDKKNQGIVGESIRGILTEKGEDDVPREFFLHPMTSWRLQSNFENGVAAGGMIDYVKLFTAIAIFILLIACINFTNLATARSERRAREVGIRKTFGSRRSQLIAQFFGESILMSLLSFAIAVVITLLVLPFYNGMVDKELFLNFGEPDSWLSGIGIILLTGVASGSYPALFLSGFNPLTTLRGTISVGKGASLPRKILVVTQFTIAILLMAGTVIVIQQINLVQSRDLGYDQENLMSVELTDALTDNYDVLKEELLQSGHVKAVTKSNSMITGINSNNFLGWPGKPSEERVIFTTIVCDYDYAETMGIEVLMGRDFSKSYGTDTAAIVINKAALDLMNLADPIGTNLDLWDGKRHLVGVVDNVLMGSPYDPVKPMFMIIGDWGGYISVRLNATNDLTGAINRIGEIFNRHNPAYPFDYKFADAEFQRKFTTIDLTRKIASLFAVLAIFITGLGIFGLASYTARQRIKEIGIRKVLGASVTSLIALLSRDFTWLVLIAFLIATPMSWYLLDDYLNRYEIRVEIAWWIYPMIGLITLIFTLFIVSNQANKAATANPVRSLRNE